ncbi:hypothetical protein PMAYCL1PPCAC_20259, partial [Pristionchus mayeri]
AYYRRSDAPVTVLWVHEKASYLFFRRSTSIFIEGSIVAPLAGGNLIVTVLMLVQTLHEIRHGMKNSSAAPRKYQERALTALKLQGIVPSWVYVIPFGYMFGLFLYAYFIAGFDSTSENHILGAISAFAIAPIQWHTFLHSLTIVLLRIGRRFE